MKTTNTVKHTPTPWMLTTDGSITNADGVDIASLDYIPEQPKQIDANAAFIVKAVNSHEELIVQLSLAHQRLDLRHDPGEVPNGCSFCSAIAKAEGK